MPTIHGNTLNQQSRERIMDIDINEGPRPLIFGDFGPFCGEIRGPFWLSWHRNTPPKRPSKAGCPGRRLPPDL